MNILGREIPKVNEKVTEKLLELGIIYVGEDNQLHVTEKIPTTPRKVQ